MNRYILITKEKDSEEKKYNLLYFQDRQRMFQELQKRVAKDESIVLASDITKAQQIDFTEMEHDPEIHKN